MMSGRGGRKSKTRKRKLQESDGEENYSKQKQSKKVNSESPEKPSSSLTKSYVTENDSGKRASDVEVRKSGHQCRKLVGAHVSIAGGLYKAVNEAVAIGAESFGMFLKSQRQWAAKPMDEKVAERFRETCKREGFDPHQILPHGSYLLNCGSPNLETLRKSRDTLIDELQRCEMLGLCLYNFHPGSTCGDISVEDCISNIAESINMAHSNTKYVITVIENMCCQGNTIGGKFEELHDIIDKVDDKSRMGVCLDTCHAFAAGFDLSTAAGYEKFTSEFQTIVGFKYLKAVHLNDSKDIIHGPSVPAGACRFTATFSAIDVVGKCGCHLDRHENIGKGHIGEEGFRRLMNDPKFDNIPMILETPGDVGYDNEIKLLHRLCH